MGQPARRLSGPSVNGPACYRGGRPEVKKLTVSIFLSILTGFIAAAQISPQLSVLPEPPLPVVNYDHACPGEGCVFGKWLVKQTVTLFDDWKNARKRIAIVKKGEVVIALTGVHISTSRIESTLSNQFPPFTSSQEMSS
jgi:hypothetical protein